MSFALRAAKHGTVTVLTKGKAEESNTAWAQGGIASVLPGSLRAEGDSVESHVADTLGAGAGLCNAEVVRRIIEEGDDAIADLLGYGVEFDKEGDKFMLGKEGGHSHRRILHARDTTGREVARAMLEAARNEPNITLLENHFVIDLITSARLDVVSNDLDLHEVPRGYFPRKKGIEMDGCRSRDGYGIARHRGGEARRGRGLGM